MSLMCCRSLGVWSEPDVFTAWTGVSLLFMWSKKGKREKHAFRGSDPFFIQTWTEGGFLLPRTHFFFLLATQWGHWKNRSFKLTRLIIKETSVLSDSYGCGKDLVLSWASLWKQKLWKLNLNFKTVYAQTFSALPLNNTAWTSVCLHLLKSQIIPSFPIWLQQMPSAVNSGPKVNVLHWGEVEIQWQ